MGNIVSNVSFGKPIPGGSVYNAPLGTTLPTGRDSTLAEAFKCVGYLSEDGITNKNGPSTKTIKAWGGDTVLVLETDKPDEWKLKLIEVLNPDVLKIVYGTDNVSGTLETGITVRANNTPHTASSWVIDILLNENKIHRVVIPNATIKEISDIVYKDDDLIAYDITLAAMPGGASFDYDSHKSFIGARGATGATGAT